MSNNLPILTFEVFRGSTPIHRVDLREPSITIGRGASALLPIDDPQLSEIHAVISVEDDGTINLLDLGSDNGLIYNGQRVSNATLRSGDVFAIGTLQFRVTISQPSVAVQQAAAPAPIAGASAQRRPVLTPDDREEEEEELPTEDVMAFILRSGTGKGSLGINEKRKKVLEVNQIWGEVLIDTKHFSRTMGHSVSIGSAVGWKWHFLGIDMGWIPVPLHMVLPYTPPMWSEVASDWRNDFYAPDDSLPGKDHTLFELTKEEYTARVQDDWDGFADVDGKRYSFDELVAAGKATKAGNVYEIPMEDNVRLMVDVDGVIFFSHLVYEGKKLLQRNSEDVDYPFVAILSFVGFLGLMFGLVMYFLPKPPENDLSEIPDRFVELLLEKPEIEKKEKKKPSGNPDAGEGAKAKKEEGKVGKKEAKMEKAKGNKVEVKKRELDRQIAENAGVLGALRDAGDLDGMFGSSGLDANLTGGIGGLIGAKGTQFGSGGLGARGSGLGGGGTAEGLGGLGTKGIGSGRSGFGSGGGNFGEKGQGGIGQVGGDPIILGALDRSLIDEVIKRHMNQIKYCYQRELTKDPSLGGKIVIKFTIAKDGTVSSASTKTTTMGNASVEQCIVSRFMRMQFPEPKGGGIVIVSYPFLFSPG
ncbi:MAG TPA: AgmX/PglI C-terminal domain-containing protein [Deltaproteobacteria bacterium]|nr:AgmX/PglI C-terminal domain-containing protein [Deltaproteobacteria bacterium]